MGAVGRFEVYADKPRLQRPNRLAALTRLRVILISWVLIYHLELALNALPALPVAEMVAMKGYLGVDGFFLLSGFALFIGYRHRLPVGLGGWADFVRRRAERIFPLHLTMLLGLVLLVGIAQAAGVVINEPQRFGAWELVTQALLVHAWETTAMHAWNYPSWALSAIWAGYLIFPVLLAPALVMRIASCWVLLAGCVAGLWLLAMTDPLAQLNRTLHLGMVRFVLEFLMGIAVARLLVARAIAAGPALAAVLLIPAGIAVGEDVLVVVGLAALVARLGMEAPSPEPPRDLMWRLGEASFGIYLCWVFVEGALVMLLRAVEIGPEMRLVLMPAGLVASLALGWLAWRLVELPAARRLACVT